MSNLVTIQAIELTSNVTPSGSQTVGGVSPNNNTFAILGAQTTSSQNGLYKVNTTGAWPFLQPLNTDIPNTQYSVLYGTYANCIIEVQISGGNNYYQVANAFNNLIGNIAVPQLIGGSVNNANQLIQTTNNSTSQYPALLGNLITGIVGQNVYTYDPTQSITTDTVQLDTVLNNLYISKQNDYDINFATYVPVVTYSGVQTLQPLNGVGTTYTTGTNNLVLLLNEGIATNNGIWQTSNTGAWTQIVTWSNIQVSSQIRINDGLYGGALYYKHLASGTGLDTGAQALFPVSKLLIVKYIELNNNLTLSGTYTVNNTPLNVGDWVVVTNQTTTANNGLYVVLSGAWYFIGNYQTLNGFSFNMYGSDNNATNTNNIIYTITAINSVSGTVYNLIQSKPELLYQTRYIDYFKPQSVVSNSWIDGFSSLQNALNATIVAPVQYNRTLNFLNNIGPIGSQENYYYGQDSNVIIFDNLIGNNNAIAGIIIDGSINEYNFNQWQNLLLGAYGGNGGLIYQATQGTQSWVVDSANLYSFYNIYGNNSTLAINTPSTNSVNATCLVPLYSLYDSFRGNINLTAGNVQYDVRLWQVNENNITLTFGAIDNTVFSSNSQLVLSECDIIAVTGTITQNAGNILWSNSNLYNSSFTLNSNGTDVTQLAFINNYIDPTCSIHKNTNLANCFAYYYNCVSFDLNMGNFDIILSPENQLITYYSPSGSSLISETLPYGFGTIITDNNSDFANTLQLNIPTSGIAANNRMIYNHIGTGTISTLQIVPPSGWSFSGFSNYIISSNFTLTNVNQNTNVMFRFDWSTKHIIIEQVNLPFTPRTTWTPADASGASLSLGSVTAVYSTINGICTIQATFTYPTTSDSSVTAISGLPFKPYSPIAITVLVTGALSISAPCATVDLSSGNIYLFSGNARLTNAQLSGAIITLTSTYIL